MPALALRLLPLALLVSCSNGALRDAGAVRPASGFGFREAAQISFRCDDSEAGGFVPVAPFVGIAVDTAINAISSALAKAQKARTASWSATQAIQLAGCPKGKLTVTRGIFSGESGMVLSGQPGPGGQTVYPAFVLQMDVVVTPTSNPGQPRTALVTVTPVSLDYAETAARSRGSKRKEVTVAVALAAIGSAPVQKADGEAGGGAASAAPDDALPAGAMLLNLGKLEIGRRYHAFTVNAATSAPMTPRHTASAIVTESEDASAALTALAAAFEGNKGDLGTAFKNSITKALSGGGGN